ncbi:MAG: hypothetical protein HOP12_14920 [Candidatus Eisenbacteria bacterium]|uniref:Uncharacterized protein n=1 Tax=Eiseniibacteriota bacterium TaxID=2212470 RepID=A0A849STL9_UNCEI|nr:hypothetical protein [Candidatus Eisenbacteria bacterium]
MLLPVLAGLLLVTVVGSFLLGLVSFHSHVGYFAPAFTADGQSIVVVERSTRGIAWGLGWEFFTPPANARAVSDELRVLRVSLDGHRIEELERWSGSPIVGRTLHEYRGRLFTYLGAGLRPQPDGSLQYGFQLSLTRVPSSELHQLHGTWSPSRTRRLRGEWDRSPFAVVYSSEPILRGARELFELPGTEAFPAAIALLDHDRRQIEIVIAAPDYARLYPKGPPFDKLMETSRKADSDFAQELERVARERQARYLVKGTPLTEAMLKADRDLQEMGYLPKPARWIATLADSHGLASLSELPRFEIAQEEFDVGLMQDIARAIAQPGVEVDKAERSYTTHRDFPNSRRVNETLEYGATEILVGHQGRLFHLRLLPVTESTRRPKH